MLGHPVALTLNHMKRTPRRVQLLLDVAIVSLARKLRPTDRACIVICQPRRDTTAQLRRNYKQHRLTNIDYTHLSWKTCLQASRITTSLKLRASSQTGQHCCRLISSSHTAEAARFNVSRKVLEVAF
mmetsp:Transcript_3576/g.10528  ORF Transcript_3576/g.10528 Transcript_3576/m.10528 type:complete len:127 (+) Transcript_3576:332-712(+)